MSPNFKTYYEATVERYNIAIRIVMEIRRTELTILKQFDFFIFDSRSLAVYSLHIYRAQLPKSVDA